MTNELEEILADQIVSRLFEWRKQANSRYFGGHQCNPHFPLDGLRIGWLEFDGVGAHLSKSALLGAATKLERRGVIELSANHTYWYVLRLSA